MKEESLVKMEFLLTLNDNFVVQRYYNVRNYNPQARASVELINLVREIDQTLSDDLKMKTVMYMMDNQDSIIEDPEVLNTSNTDDAEWFHMYIKVGDEVIFHRVIDAKLFPPKVRYTVDVRPHLKEILRGLTEIFSSENLSTDYLGYQLAR
jgi:hypothetical protein